MTLVSAEIPPPPIPWTARPASRVAKLLAIEAMMDPTVKNRMADMRTDFRSMMWEMDIQVGMKMVLVKRKDVPVQKASMAVPCRAVAIVLDGCECGILEMGKYTYR